MSEQDTTLDEFAITQNGPLSDKPNGIRLALDEVYPEEWGFAELDSICEINSGFTWNKDQETDSSEEGAVPVIKIGNVQDGYLDLTDTLYLQDVSDKDLNKNKVREDWLLMIGSNGSSERVGQCGLIEQDMEFVYASFLYGLRANEEYIIPRYLFYSLNRPKVQNRLTSFTAGSTSLKNLNKSTIENLSLPIPPLEEQRKVASVLYTVDQAIQKTEEIIDQTQRLGKGVMQELFSDGAWDHTDFQETQYGTIPAEWEIKTVNEVSSRIGSGGTPDTDKDEYYGGEIDWVKTDDLNSGLVTTTKTKITRKGLDESAAKLFPEGTVVFAMYGGALGQNGRLGMEAAMNQACCGIVADSTKIDPYLLHQQLIHRKQQLTALSAGTHQQNISQSMIQKFEVFVPSLEEQSEMVSILSNIEQSINDNHKEKERLKRLKRGLMQDFLSGEIRTTDCDIYVSQEVKKHG